MERTSHSTWDVITGFNLILDRISQLKGGLAAVPDLQRSKTQIEFKDSTDAI